MSDEAIGPEQLLIGLAKGAVRGRLFDSWRFACRNCFRMNVLPQPEDTHGREMVFTERSKRIIELAFEESRAMRHLDIGGEHLLLALLHEGESPGARVLQRKGLTGEGILAELW